jgi:hypothetical protein
MKQLLALMVAMIIVASCNQDSISPRLDLSKQILPRSFDFSNLRQALSNYNRIVIATSKWIATQNARDWIQSLKARKSHNVDEILILQILCSDEGDSFMQQYNSGYLSSTSKNALIEDLYENAPFICIKIDYNLDGYISILDNYIPVITEFDFQNIYLNGASFNGSSILQTTGGDLIAHYKVTSAFNTVLYDPNEHTFNPPLFFPVCDEFFDAIENLGDEICTGEVPLSISYDLQGILIETCGAQPQHVMEICDNDVDDDGDDLIDCDDPDCCGYAFCNCGSVLGEEICDNSIDDDGDNLIDGNDPDCFGITSPCMRDHFIEDNYFYGLQMQSAQQLGAMGINICGGHVDITNPQNSGGLFVAGDLYGINSVTALEEWYDFLIKIHWGSESGSTGFFQELVYRFNIFELSNGPEYSYSTYSVGQPGTGGGGGVLILTVTQTGLTQTKEVSLGPILFYVISDICGINNWDPGVLGDKVRISIHEFDPCTLNTTNGTVSTNTTTHTYSSELSINLGLKATSIPKAELSGGLLYKNTNTLATSNTNTISSSYTTNYSNDYYLGGVNYSYCWADQNTVEQIHQLPFGNLVYLRMSAEKCP